MVNKRGLYAKGAAKKAEILDTALSIIEANGYSGATVKELAEAVGLSQNGLLHYFGSKDALFTEVVRRRDERDADAFTERPEDGAGLVESISRVVRRNASEPGFIQLYSRLSNEATERSHYAHDYFREHFEVTRDATAEAFRTLQKNGQLDAGYEPEKLAALLWALSDGVQTQWLFDRSMDMPAHIEYFLQLIGLRAGGEATDER